MMSSNVRKYIVSVPNINGGLATIAGTRVTVAEIIDYLENETAVKSVIKDLNTAGVIVTRDEVLAALEFAKHKSLDETSKTASKSK